MRLTELQILSLSTITDADINDIAAIRESTITSSPLARLRFSKVPHDEALSWLQRSTSVQLEAQMHKPRISSLFDQTSKPRIDTPLPTTTAAFSHLVIRDLDLPQQPTEPSTFPSSPPTPSPGTIVSYAIWAYLPSGPPSAGEYTFGTPVPAPASTNTALMYHFENLLEATCNETFGDLPCFCLTAISTLTPSHLRRGMARQLVQWIEPFSDEWNLPVQLAGTRVGVKVYEKCGFEEVGGVEMDLGEWGWEQSEGDESDEGRVHWQALMVRWPRDKGALDERWKGWRRGKGLE